MKKIYIITFVIALLLLTGGRIVAQTITPTPSPIITPKEDITEKIKDKVEKTKKNPKAYIGSVTDKSENSIQIKSVKGEIEQISITKETAFVKIGKNVTKVKYEDLALGDFIAALGYANGNKVLESSRIIITVPPTPINKSTKLVGVTKVTKKEVFVSDKKDGSEIIMIPTDTTLTLYKKAGEFTKSKFSNIEVEDSLVVVGTQVKDRFETTLVYMETPLPTPTPTAKPTPTPKR